MIRFNIILDKQLDVTCVFSFSNVYLINLHMLVFFQMPLHYGLLLNKDDATESVFIYIMSHSISYEMIPQILYSFRYFIVFTWKFALTINFFSIST